MHGFEEVRFTIIAKRKNCKEKKDKYESVKGAIERIFKENDGDTDIDEY